MRQNFLFTHVVIPVAFVAIVIYLIFSAWIGIRDAYPTTIAYADTMEDSVSASGWVIRGELPIQAGEGLVQLVLQEGEKVGMGQAVANIYQDERYIEDQELLLTTQTNLTQLQYSTWKDSPSGITLEEQLLTAMIDLRTGASSGNFTSLADETANYRKLVLRREYLVSSQAAAAMDAAVAALAETYASLQANQTKGTTITAAASGTFSTHLDGYETLLSPDLLAGLNPDKLDSFSEMTPMTIDGTLGKIITATAWYYAITVDGEYAASFTVGRNADVHFDALDETLSMRVYSVGETQEGRAVVIFRSNQGVGDSAQLRQETCRVVFPRSEGLHIPKEALRVTEDGEVGVFIRSGYKARFRPVDILTENESAYLVAPTSDAGTRILRAGDEVILASDELYDGKVVR